MNRYRIQLKHANEGVTQFKMVEFEADGFEISPTGVLVLYRLVGEGKERKLMQAYQPSEWKRILHMFRNLHEFKNSPISDTNPVYRDSMSG